MRGIIETYATRAEWLAAREGRIGASEVAAILGISPWVTAWDLWERKTTGRPDAATPEQERGTSFEPVVLWMYASRTGLQVGASVALPPVVAWPKEHKHMVLRHPDHAWAIQSPDALVDLGVDFGQVEAKTSTSPAEWGEPCTITPGWDEAWPVPVHYAVQCYWQIEVAGVEWVDLAVLLPYFELRVYRILPDPERQQQILARVAAWRQLHLIEGVPPEPDESDACRRYVRGLPAKGERAATTEEETVAFELAQARARRKLEDREVRRLANQLGALADGATLRLRSGRKLTPRPPESEQDRPDVWGDVDPNDFAALHVGP